MSLFVASNITLKIDEVNRVTEENAELSEDQMAVLDMKQQMLEEIISEEPGVTITYFVPDKRKSGGEYMSVTGRTFKTQWICEGHDSDGQFQDSI